MTKRNHGDIAIGTLHNADEDNRVIQLMNTRDLINVEDAEKYLRHEVEMSGDDSFVVIKLVKRFRIKTRRVLVPDGDDE